MEAPALRVVLYSRVSTAKQTTANQTIELRQVCSRNNWNIIREITDNGISGAKGRSERPGFDELHKIVSRKDADMIVVWSLDRLGRSTVDLANFMGELETKNVSFYSHTQSIDSRTPSGKMSFAIFAAIAEFERNMIRERVCAGLARVKAEGKKLGRPSRVNENTIIAVRLMREKGMAKHKIAKELGIGCGTVQQMLAA